MHFHDPNSAQAVQRLSSELHDQDQAGRYCQQSAFGRKPAVSFESGFELPPQAAVRGNAIPVGATLTFLWCFCCSRRRFLSKHIPLATRTCAFCASLACISCSKYSADTALVRQPECYQHSGCFSSGLQSCQRRTFVQKWIFCQRCLDWWWNFRFASIRKKATCFDKKESNQHR